MYDKKYMYITVTQPAPGQVLELVWDVNHATLPQV